MPIFPIHSWWCHPIVTFCALLALCLGNSPVTDEFSSQRPVTHSFDVFFDLHLNKRLSTQSRPQWFETSSRSSWCHCNVNDLSYWQRCWYYHGTLSLQSVTATPIKTRCIYRHPIFKWVAVSWQKLSVYWMASHLELSSSHVTNHRLYVLPSVLNFSDDT